MLNPTQREVSTKSKIRLLKIHTSFGLRKWKEKEGGNLEKYNFFGLDTNLRGDGFGANRFDDIKNLFSSTH